MFPSRILLSYTLAVAAFVALGRAQEPIKVGEVASLTGKDATFGQSSHDGTLLAIEQINAGAACPGCPISLLTEDDACRPGDAATAARKLISRDKVVALLGEVASGRSLEMAPIAQEEKVPEISPRRPIRKVTAVGNYIFRVCFIDPFQGAVMAKFARGSLKLQRVAVLDSVSNAYSVGLSKFFKTDFAADGGTIALEQKYTEGDKDFRAQLTVIKAAGVDGIFVPGYLRGGRALICVQARELGLTLPIFGGDAWEGDPLIAIGGPAVEGIYFSDHFSPENDAPLTRTFVQKFPRPVRRGKRPTARPPAAMIQPWCWRTRSGGPARSRAGRCATPWPRPPIFRA